MIKIDLFKNEKNLMVAYEVNGHADYAEEGKDIVENSGARHGDPHAVKSHGKARESSKEGGAEKS